MFYNYNDIKSEYERIRERNIYRYDERKKKIYDAYPELLDYDINVSELQIAIGRAKFENSDISEISKKLEDVKAKREKFLKEHNIDSDYQNAIYDCEKCKDIGFINGEKCSCYVQKEIDLFDNISHFKQYIESDNFSNLDMSFYRQSDVKIGDQSYMDYMKNVVDNIKRGVRFMDQVPYNCIFIGKPGTGKTFLARCAGAEALKNNKSVLYLNINEYLNSLKPDYDGESLKPYAVACDLLILDDLGTEKITDFTNTEINYVIDKRLNDKKSTIITTNYNMDDIERDYLSPTYSRLEHLFVKCCLFGEDLRRIKNANV